jgi:hypothetical protein
VNAYEPGDVRKNTLLFCGNNFVWW